MKEVKTDSIKLFWAYDDIVDECVNLAAMYLKNRDDELFEELLLTKYDELFFENQIEKALYDAYHLICSLGVSVDETLTFRDEDGNISFEILNSCDSDGNQLYDISLITAIDRGCFRFITDSVLIEWGENGALKEVVARLKEGNNDNINRMKEQFFVLKNVPYAHSYTIVDEEGE